MTADWNIFLSLTLIAGPPELHAELHAFSIDLHTVHARMRLQRHPAPISPITGHAVEGLKGARGEGGWGSTSLPVVGRPLFGISVAS